MSDPARYFVEDLSSPSERLNKPLPLSPHRLQRQSDTSASIASDLSKSFFILPATTYNPKNNGTIEDGSTATSDENVLLGPTMSGPQELSGVVDAMPVDSSSSEQSKQSPRHSQLRSPTRPLTFSSIADGNPFYDDDNSTTSPSSPILLPPPLTVQKRQITSEQWPFRVTKTDSHRTELPPQDDTPHVTRMFQNSSSNHGFEKEVQNVQGPVPTDKASNASIGETSRDRGRPFRSPYRARDVNDGVVTPKTPRTRSRSPIKKLLGIGKSDTPRSDNPSRPQLDCSSPCKTPTKKPTQVPSSNSTSQAIRRFGHRLKYGFLTADEYQLKQERMMEEHSDTSSPDCSGREIGHITIMPPFPHVSSLPPSPGHKASASAPSSFLMALTQSTANISLQPPAQARLLSDLELMVVTQANNFLLREFHAGRLSSENISRIKNRWESHPFFRSAVVDFSYDQGTQHDLVVANLRTVRLHGDAADDPHTLNATLYSWKIMAREMAVRTFCTPDSQLRKWLHDGREVLVLLGANHAAIFALDQLQLSTLTAMAGKQAERYQEEKKERQASGSDNRKASEASQKSSASVATPTPVPPATHSQAGRKLISAPTQAGTQLDVLNPPHSSGFVGLGGLNPHRRNVSDNVTGTTSTGRGVVRHTPPVTPSSTLLHTPRTSRAVLENNRDRVDAEGGSAMIAGVDRDSIPPVPPLPSQRAFDFTHTRHNPPPPLQLGGSLPLSNSLTNSSGSGRENGRGTGRGNGTRAATPMGANATSVGTRQGREGHRRQRQAGRGLGLDRTRGRS